MRFNTLFSKHFLRFCLLVFYIRPKYLKIAENITLGILTTTISKSKVIPYKTGYYSRPGKARLGFVKIYNIVIER